MKSKTVNVIPFNQDGQQIFVTVLTARDLLDFTTIDKYNSSLEPTDPAQGYQRPEEKARARKISKYLTGQEHPLLPTAILLSARGSGVKFDESSSSVALNDESLLQLVDGQHRIAGLRHTIDDAGKTSFLNFAVPVVIMQGLSKVEEMEQFRTVNGTQKSVRTDLVNMILSQIVAAKGEDAIPPKDFWKVVVSRAIERLNANDESVWFDMIIMPDQLAYRKREVDQNPELASRRIVRATSFMQSLKPLYGYLREYLHIPNSWDADQQAEELARILTEYWNAIVALCPDPFKEPKDYVIQKTPGVFSLHTVCMGVARNMHLGRRDFVQEQFKVMLQAAEEAPSEVLSESFWRARNGRAAEFGSMKGFRQLAEIIAAEIGIDM